MATLEGANPQLRAAVERMIADSNGKLSLTSGVRTNAEQTALYNASDHSGTMVAAPGTSNHEKGLAADIGGDMDYLAQVAPRYGLHMPMSYEPWHVELADGTQSDPASRGTAPLGAPPQDYMHTLAAMMGGLNGDAVRGTAATALSSPYAVKRTPTVSAGMGATGATLSPGPEDTMLDAFRLAVRKHESSDNYTVLGVPTPWGKASGAYQYLDGTWGHYKGYARAADAPPAVQDEKARMDMQALYDRFGDWGAVASAWFAGPDGNFNTAEVRQYASAILGLMGGK